MFNKQLSYYSPRRILKEPNGARETVVLISARRSLFEPFDKWRRFRFRRSLDVKYIEISLKGRSSRTSRFVLYIYIYLLFTIIYIITTTPNFPNDSYIYICIQSWVHLTNKNWPTLELQLKLILSRFVFTKLHYISNKGVLFHWLNIVKDMNTYEKKKSDFQKIN